MPPLTDDPTIWVVTIVALWLYVTACVWHDRRAARKEVQK